MSKPITVAPCLGLLLLCACDASGPDPGNACVPDPAIAIACDVDGDCPAYACSCADGGGGNHYARCTGGTCETSIDGVCEDNCAGRGGVEEAAALPNPTVVGSPECEAWCERLVAESARLGCGGVERCAPYADCEIAEDECGATARERLACMAASAEFSCADAETLQVGSDCEPSASCDGDACLR